LADVHTAYAAEWHSFISGMHHYAKFVAPNADISLQSGL